MYDDGYPEAQPSSGALGLHLDDAALLPAGRTRSKTSVSSIGLPAAAPLLQNIGAHPAGGGSGQDSGEEDGSMARGEATGGGMLQHAYEVDRRTQQRAAAYVVEQGGEGGGGGEEPSLRFGMA